MKFFKSFLICVFLLTIFISCRDNARKNILTNNSIKYWDWYSYPIDGREGANSFSTDNKCRSYVYDRKGERRLFYSGDVVYNDSTWHFSGDTSLFVEGFERQILKFTADTIILQNIKTLDSILLIRSQVQSID
jgi:hypothetical protein